MSSKTRLHSNDPNRLTVTQRALAFQRMKKTFVLSLLIIASMAYLAGADVKTNDPAPDFTLTSCDGKTVKLSDYRGKIVVLEWFNYGCPFVRKHYKNGDMQALQAMYTRKGIIWLGINSTHPKHENFLTPEKVAAQCKKLGIKSTAMLADPDGHVGRLYGARTTPHFFIINAQGHVAYQGAIDDQRFPMGDPKKANANYIHRALAELLAGQTVSLAETKPYGCSVKYGD